MAILTRFDTPAFVRDIPDDATKQSILDDLWSANIARWVSASLIGDIFAAVAGFWIHALIVAMNT